MPTRLDPTKYAGGSNMMAEDPKPAAPIPNRPGYIPASGHVAPNMPDIYKRLREAHQARHMETASPSTAQTSVGPQITGGVGWQNPLVPQTHLPGAPSEGEHPGYGQPPRWDEREKPMRDGQPRTRESMIKEFQETPPSYMQGISPEILKRLWEDILRQIGQGKGRRV